MVKASGRIKTIINYPFCGKTHIEFSYHVINDSDKICGFTRGKAKVKPGKISLHIFNVSISSKCIFDDQLYLGARIKTDNVNYKIISNGKNEIFSNNPKIHRKLEYANITPTTESIKINIQVFIDKDAANKFDKDIQEFESLNTQEGEEKITLDEYMQNILKVEALKPSLETDFSKLNIKPLGYVIKEIYFDVIDDSVLMPPPKKAKIV